MRGGERSRSDLPGGYQLTLRTRELHGSLQALLAAPSPTGPAGICTARFSSLTPLPAVSRILDAVTRYAPALPDARDAHPPGEAVARLLTTGALPAVRRAGAVRPVRARTGLAGGPKAAC
jgi:hypothetical protein